MQTYAEARTNALMKRISLFLNATALGIALVTAAWGQITPNDPKFSKQWGLHNTGQRLSGGIRGTADADIDAPEAWGITTGSPDVIIAVLDTGIDINHPDLAANIWTNPDEIPGDGVDNDGNGYVDDIHGWDFFNNDNTVYDPAEDSAHGTAVAGVIAAVGNNGIGIAGVSWQAKIMVLKIHNEIGVPPVGHPAAVAYAAAKGAKTINASFYGQPGNPAMKDAIEASDVLFVAIAGNESADIDVDPVYPTCFDLPNIIAVAATDQNDQLASFSSSLITGSNYGATNVDLAAPGTWILTTTPGNGYGYWEGTSFAAPHVVGVAALIYARYPNLTAVEVKERIMASVDPLPSLTGKCVTGGRLNAFKALLDQPPSVAITSPADGAAVAGAITISATATDDVGVKQVSFYLDGATLLGTDAEAPYEILWDSASVADGTHSITAVATDTVDQTASHTVTVLVDNYNAPPIANAGPDQTVTDADNDGAELVTLDGSASFDSDGTIVAYEWSDGTMVLGTSASINLVLQAGFSYSFILTVTDNEGATASDTVAVEVLPPSADIEVFNDSFEDGSLSPWTQDSQNDWFAANNPVFDGAFSAKVDGSASDAQLISPLIDLQGRTAATITFAWFISGSLDNGEYLACDVSTNGGSTWTEAARLSGKNGVKPPENAWQSATLEVSSAAGSVRLRFRGKMNSTDEFANVDAVRVVAH
jgi:hypothetical protein